MKHLTSLALGACALLLCLCCVGCAEESCPDCCECECSGSGSWGSCTSTGTVESYGGTCLDCQEACQSMCSDSSCPFKSASECSGGSVSVATEPIRLVPPDSKSSPGRTATDASVPDASCAPTIFVTPPAMTFMTATAAIPEVHAFKVANTGCADLVLQSVALASPTTAFVLLKAPASGSTVAAGATTTFQVRAAPADGQDETNMVIIKSNDPVKPTVEIALSAKSAASPTQGGADGDPCTTNQECDSGYCVAAPGGGQACTKLCVDTCPKGWKCTSLASSKPDVVYVCLPEGS